MLLISLFLFLTGLIFGSFFLVLADRLPRGESPLGGRSYCETCKHTLSWYDLLPVLSFVSTGGKCRYCHTSLSIYYPSVEIITGILFALTYVLTSSTHNIGSFDGLVALIFYLFTVSVFIIVFFTDLKYMIIPFAVVIPAIIFTILFLLFTTPEQIVHHLLASIGAGGFFLAIFLLTRGKGMGFGDVILALYLGLVLGFPSTVLGLYTAFLTGAVVSIILILRGRKKLKGGTVPFGPFLILGGIVALFWGELIIKAVYSYLLIL